jgi:5-methylcytosine-specific restriction endonuclease McrA
MRRLRRVEGLKLECTHPDHVGPRMLPRGWFESRGGGKHSHCRVCRRSVKVGARARRRERMEGPGVSQAYLQGLWVKQGGRCAICGGSMVEWEVDHVIPLARGGRHEESNVQLAHPKCNRRKGAKLA